MTYVSLIPRRAAHRGLRPFGLQAAGLDRLFDEVWSGLRGRALADPAPRFSPRIDVEETEESIRFTAELPGLEEKDFEVTLEGDVLSIRGEKRDESEPQGEGSLWRETVRGTFRRAFQLPFEVDPDGVEACYARGVLQITVPRPEEARPQVRTIPVTAS